MLTRAHIQHIVQTEGADILTHQHMHIERACYQHGTVTTFAHSIRVACLALWLADRLGLIPHINTRTLVRAALLHDYFLYDWHDKDDNTHRLHGFTHPQTALINAEHDFTLNQKEKDAIARHMFPLTPLPPRSLEGWLVTLADKISATHETLFERGGTRDDLHAQRLALYALMGAPALRMIAIQATKQHETKRHQHPPLDTNRHPH